MTLPPPGILAPPALDVPTVQVRPVTVRDTLTAAGVDVRDVTATVAPQVVTYRIKLGPGVAPSKVHRAVDALSLALGTTVRYAGIGGGAVLVEATRTEREMVSLTEPGANLAHAPATSLPLGVYTSGREARFNLHELPHLLVAGTTGSGKSTFLTSLLTSLLLRSTPEQVRLVLVDPKRVELAAFAGVPHLIEPVVSDVHDAAAALRRVGELMDRRYEMGIKDLDAHNAANPDNPLPRVVVVVDELADLMLRVGKQVEPLVVRIAQLGRAAGVHLVLATQRPDAKTFTGLILSNIPARVAFAVIKHTESSIALGHTGAEKLAGKGDGLFKSPKVGAPMRFQSAFVSDEDASRVVKWWKRERPVESAPQTPAPLPAVDPAALEQARLRAELDVDDPVDEDLRIESTPAEILYGAGFTSDIVDAFAEVLTERIAAGVLESITRSVKGES